MTLCKYCQFFGFSFFEMTRHVSMCSYFIGQCDYQQTCNILYFLPENSFLALGHQLSPFYRSSCPLPIIKSNQSLVTDRLQEVDAVPTTHAPITEEGVRTEMAAHWLPPVLSTLKSAVLTASLLSVLSPPFPVTAHCFDGQILQDSLLDEGITHTLQQQKWQKLVLNENYS